MVTNTDLNNPFIFVEDDTLRKSMYRICHGQFLLYTMIKNHVPQHMLAPSVAACDILSLRASAHSPGNFDFPLLAAESSTHQFCLISMI